MAFTAGHPPLDRRRFLAGTAGGSAWRHSPLFWRRTTARRGRHRSAAPKPPHFKATAKSAIFIFLVGGTSQVDLFDAKPALAKLHGKPIPESFRAGVRLGQTNYARAGDADAVQVPPLRQVRHGAVRAAAANRRLCRRHRSGPLDAPRGVRPRAGRADAVHRQGAARSADHGRVADLRPRQRVPRPARLRRAAERPLAEGAEPRLGQRLPAGDASGRPVSRHGLADPRPGDAEGHFAGGAPCPARRGAQAECDAPRRDEGPEARRPDRGLRTGLPDAVGRSRS